jgi:hypothetical protein
VSIDPATEVSDLEVVWQNRVGRAPAAFVQALLLTESWTPELLNRLLDHAAYATSRGPVSWMFPGDGEGEALPLIAERLTAMVMRYRKVDVQMPLDRIVDWLGLAAAGSYGQWVGVDVMLLSGAETDTEDAADHQAWQQVPIGVAPLAWAAGLTPDDALHGHQQGTVTAAGLSTLAGLRHWHFSDTSR